MPSGIALEVALETNPVHLAAALDVEARRAHRRRSSRSARRADGRNVVLGVARRDARRAAGAAREIDRHRPTTLRHAARVVRIVHALLRALIGRRRRTELTLRVGRDRRAKSRQERVARVARQRSSFCAFSLGRLVQIRRVDRLRDAATVLARRTFGARQRAMIARLGDRRLRRGQHETAGGVGADRNQIERVDAEVARVATVAPLHVPASGASDRTSAICAVGRDAPGRAESRSRPCECRGYGNAGARTVPLRRLHLENVAALDAESLARSRGESRPTSSSRSS